MRTEKELKKEIELLTAEIKLHEKAGTSITNFKYTELRSVRAILKWVLGDDSAYHSQTMVENYKKGI